MVRTGKADIIGNAVGQHFLLVFLLYGPSPRPVARHRSGLSERHVISILPTGTRC
jgi:hypothetical protein